MFSKAYRWVAEMEEVADFVEKDAAMPAILVTADNSERLLRQAAQVRAYGQLLGPSDCTSGRQLRTGLLFSADGSLHWV